MAQSAAAAAVSTRNPAPCDLGQAVMIDVMKIDTNGLVRARGDDEGTEAGCESTHARYIICPATAVRAMHSFLALRPTPLLTVAFCLAGLRAQRTTHGHPHRAVFQVPSALLLGHLAGGR